jgi:hypothetical protein
MVLSEKSTGRYASIPRSFAPSTIASAASSSVASKTLVRTHWRKLFPFSTSLFEASACSRMFS